MKKHGNPATNGAECFRMGLKEKDNPHCYGSRGYRQWLAGYTREKRKPTKGNSK